MDGIKAEKFMNNILDGIFIAGRSIYTISFLLLLFTCYTAELKAQTEECLICHEDQSLTYERGSKSISLFVSGEKYLNSVHGSLECTDCHSDFNPDDLPHKEGEKIYRVECSGCHETSTFNESVHAIKNVGCPDCHSKHEIQFASTLHDKAAEFCTTCHKQANVKGFLNSIHYAKFKEGKLSPTCIDCHGNTAHEIEPAKFNEEKLHELCVACHDNAVKNFEKSLHGKALSQGKFLAPNCITCHSSHGILSSKNEASKTYKMNIPSLCGNCHKDGTRVSELKTVSQRHVLEDYAESIHGDGLFKRGLLVTAVCTDCHYSHNILPHEDPNSSINKNNISATCTQCHVQIEKVHVKVIKGELWEKQPHKIPACIDCHEPHKVRRVFYEESFTNNLCISCHGNSEISKTVDGKKVSLYVDINQHLNSGHKDKTCINCHTNVNISNNPVCLNSGPVDCSSCHAEVVAEYQVSLHGKLYSEKNVNAPYCTDCHGKHDVMLKSNYNSPIFSKNIPNLCAKCHREGEKAAKLQHSSQHDIIKNYTMSIHGKGLLESGLMVTATCIDCHTSHKELPAKDPLSSVNKNNISETCAKCHLGIYEQFKNSIHDPRVADMDKELPVCSDCHQSHTIIRTDAVGFRQGIIDQCGRCHMDVTETYFDTFHGKVSKLGSLKTAKCYDCHGAHNILPNYYTQSTLSRENIIETCKTCHPNSNRKFVGYLTHATHHDKDKYPFLYYTFWAMTILLVSTFTFFGLHTLLWLPRALAEKKKQRKGVK